MQIIMTTPELRIPVAPPHLSKVPRIMAPSKTAFASSFVPKPVISRIRTCVIPQNPRNFFPTSVRCTLANTQIENPDIKRMHAGPLFNQVAVHNGIVYLSGQVARGTDGSVAGQTRAILEKIDGLLQDAGTEKSRILSATIWMTDIKQVAEMNAEWDRWVDKDNMPVRACVQSALVADDITVEIQVTAALPSPAKIVATDAAAAAVGPYNQGVVVRDGTVFVSGCIGLTADTGEMAGTTVEEQTTQALKNLKAIVESAGANVKDIVKTTVLLDDIADFAAVNVLYASFFDGGSAPARSCFAAKQLPKGALVEIEAIAILP